MEERQRRVEIEQEKVEREKLDLKNEKVVLVDVVFCHCLYCYIYRVNQGFHLQTQYYIGDETCFCL
jgi:hypothetical protein